MQTKKVFKKKAKQKKSIAPISAKSKNTKKSPPGQPKE